MVLCQKLFQQDHFMTPSERYLPVTPIQQTGSNCKVVALTCVEKYWGTRLNFFSIPLHKNTHNHADKHYDTKPAAYSMRQIAKTHRSVQGELLEVTQLTKIMGTIGYQSHIVNCMGNKELFINTIKHHILKEQPLICFFSVYHDYDSCWYKYGLPNTDPALSSQFSEHAAVIIGFNLINNTVRVAHWEGLHDFNIDHLYESTMLLKEQRDKESYYKLGIYSRRKKYELSSNDPQNKASINPANNSGFKGQLVVIEAPDIVNIKNHRLYFERKLMMQQGLQLALFICTTALLTFLCLAFTIAIINAYPVTLVALPFLWDFTTKILPCLLVMGLTPLSRTLSKSIYHGLSHGVSILTDAWFTSLDALDTDRQLTNQFDLHFGL